MYSAKHRVTIKKISCYYYLKTKLVLCSFNNTDKATDWPMKCSHVPSTVSPTHFSANPMKLRALTKHPRRTMTKALQKLRGRMIIVKIGRFDHTITNICIGKYQ